MDTMYSAVIDLAEKHGFDRFYISNNELKVRGVCPLCLGGPHEDKDSFSINVRTGAWNCKRGSCTGINGKKEGTFKELCAYFGEQPPVTYAMPQKTVAQKRTFQKPNPDDLKPLTEEIITYCATRGISEETLKDWKISSDEKGNIVFPFYRNEELVFVKYRRPKKYVKGDGPKEWRMENTESILFGMDMVSFNKPLVITEGQMDALALYESGVSNVVSVPSGAQDLNWIDTCWEWLEKFNDIILFGDSDEPGMDLVATLSKRLGEDRCMVPREYPEFIWKGQDMNRVCKDANEILMAYGPDTLKNIVDSCEPAPVKGLIDVGTVKYIDPSLTPRILTKIPMLDNMIGGLNEGGITVLSGRRGEGKSTIGNSLMLNAIQQGYKCAVYSGELDSQQFCEWLFNTAVESKYISYKTIPSSGKNVATISTKIWDRVGAWLQGKMYLYDNKIVFEEDPSVSVIKLFEICARRYGCKLFLIDNLMSILTTGDDENRAQAKFMARVKAFATKYRVHVLCVCHPRKEKEGAVFSNDSVSGSSVLTNLADNVFSIEKPNIRVNSCSLMQ